MGGDHYPIIGRLELKTIQGFQINDTFANLTKRLQIKVLNVPENRYSVTFFSGNTQGQIVFVLYVKDDFYLDQESGVAKLYIDGEEFTGKNIIIQCNRKLNYNKYVVVNSTTVLQSFSEPLRISAGDKVTVNITGIQDQLVVVQPETQMFLPYDKAIYVNYWGASSQVLPSSQFVAVDDPIKQYTSFTFTGLTKVGTAAIVGSGIPDNFFFNITISPGPMSSDYSSVTLE